MPPTAEPRIWDECGNPSAGPSRSTNSIDGPRARCAGRSSPVHHARNSGTNSTAHPDRDPDIDYTPQRICLQEHMAWGDSSSERDTALWGL